MRTVVIILFAVNAVAAHSQSHYSVLSTYPLHHSYYNPAALNHSSNLQISLVSRKRWVGLEGSPFTTFLAARGYVQKIKTSFGLVTSYYTAGYSRESKMELQFAKRFITKKVKIQIGLSGIFLSHSYQNPQWNTIDPSRQDPAIPVNFNDTGISLSGGIGIWNKSFFAFAGSQHITEPELDDIAFSYQRSYTLSAGLNIPFSNAAMITPSFFAITNINHFQVQADLNLLFKTIYAGAGYRLQDAVILQGGYHGKKIKAGYAFDITTSQLKNYSNGSHEIYFSWFIPGKSDELSCGCNSYKNTFARSNMRKNKF